MTKATTGTIYNHFTGEVRTLPMVQAEHMVTNTFGEWSFKKPLPPGWEREEPRYRLTIDLYGPVYDRYRREMPVNHSTDQHEWQYCPVEVSRHAPLKAGSEIVTTSWPNPSMVPLNETARRVRDFFTSQPKSRLQMAPWRDGRLNLDTGLSGVTGFTPPPLPRLPGVQMPGAR